MRYLAIIIAIFALTGCKSVEQASQPATPAEAVAQAAAKGKLAALLEQAQEQYFPADEATFGEYLAAALATGKLSDTDAQKAEWMLDYYIRKNAPGTVAADFRFATPEHSECTLHTFLPGQPLTLIIYDPDCDHCRDVIKQLNGLQGNVLALCVESTPQRWEQTRSALPEGWIKAFDRTGILDQDLYSAYSLPQVFLLDGERKVILKNPTPEALLQQK